MVRLEREAWDRLAGITNYAYNCFQLVSITDAEGQTTAYEYNDLGQQTKETYPDRTPGSTSWTLTYGIVEFAYDPAERMFRKTDQLGDTVTMNFNLASQMTRRDYRTKANSPSGTITDRDTFSFDRSGRMLTGVSGRYTNTVTNVFDALGQHKEEKLTIAGQTYAVGYDYDALGRRFKTTYPDATTVERTYTNRSQLHQTKFNGSVIDTRVYDVGGRLSTSTYANGAVPDSMGLVRIMHVLFAFCFFVRWN